MFLLWKNRELIFSVFQIVKIFSHRFFLTEERGDIAERMKEMLLQGLLPELGKHCEYIVEDNPKDCSKIVTCRLWIGEKNNK